MALSLLVGGGRTPLGFKKSGEAAFSLELDLVTSERHERRAEITQFPIEDGSTISDHIILRPKTIKLEGLVSNTPIQILGGLSFEDRVQNAFDVLEQLYENKEILTVVSGLDVYEDMAFSELIYPRDFTTGQALEVKATLEKISKVQMQTVIIPSQTNSQQAMPEQDVGLQGAENIGIFTS